MRTALLLAVTVAFGGIATAQTPIGPFTGTESDGFETQQSGSFDPCIVGRVFNNNGDLCTPGSSGSHITGGWSFMCTIQEHGGSRFTGSAGGAYEYTFDSPVSRFGGYFGTNAGPPGGGTANFYDAANNFLGSQVIAAPADCTWTWNGWQDDSGAGFSRIEVPSNVFGGAFLMMDDMEADFGGGGFGTDQCFGDGSGTACPCGNSSANGGCANSTGDGCTLSALPAAGGTLNASNAIPGQPGLFFQGDNSIGGGTGATFGDGLRCCGSNVVRLSVVVPDGNGAASISGIQAGGGASSGDTKCYQYWYRNPNGSPCGFGFNLSNAVSITW
ncbi:MAG: hypothetical protein VYE81_01255 [Planctomycetota bacterium]|nr:hypothetical protein [Planctomycetota bacterium]